MEFTIKEIIRWGIPVIQLITAVLAIRCWRKKKSFEWQVFILACVLTFLIEVTGKITGRFLHLNNHWLYNIYFIFFYCSLITFYAGVFANQWIKKCALTLAATLFAWDIIYFIINGVYRLNTSFPTIGGAIVLCFAIIYLAIIFIDNKIETPLSKDPVYWFSTGFILYFSHNIVLIGLLNSLLKEPTGTFRFFSFYINHALTLVVHVFLWKGLHAARK